MQKKSKTIIVSFAVFFVAVIFLSLIAAFLWYFKASLAINDGMLKKTIENSRLTIEKYSRELNICRTDVSGMSQTSSLVSENTSNKYRDEILKNVFFDEKIKVGDKVLGWKVKSIEKAEANDVESCDEGDGGGSISNCFPNNIAIKFSGKETISGLVKCVEADNGNGGYKCVSACINNFDVASEVKIPRYKNDKKEMEICFLNDDLEKAGMSVGPEPKKYEIVISDLALTSDAQGGMNNYATLVKIVSPFVLDDLKIGDKVLGMKVVAMKNTEYMKVLSFSGQVTVTGDFEKTLYEDIPLVCLKNFTDASEAKLPKLYKAGGKTAFCLEADDKLVKEKLLSFGDAGRATITIDDLSLVDCACGAYSNANLINVVSVSKK